MRIIFVGTASGKTSSNRNHSSFYIQSEKHNLLVDCGDGISKALLNLDLEFNSINSILLTHLHADHFSGLAALLTQMKLNKRTTPLNIYAHRNLVLYINNFLIMSYLFKEKMTFALNIVPFDFSQTMVLTNDISFIAKQNSHIVQTEIVNNYPSEIFISASVLFMLGSKKIFYTSDIGSPKDLLLFENEKPDWLISEATHLDLVTILQAHKKLGTKRLFITHYDDDLATELDLWRKNQTLTDCNSINICADRMEIDIV